MTGRRRGLARSAAGERDPGERARLQQPESTARSFDLSRILVRCLLESTFGEKTLDLADYDLKEVETDVSKGE
jgi:hypothetical protein